jgi:hypothetical protein
MGLLDGSFRSSIGVPQAKGRVGLSLCFRLSLNLLEEVP